MRRTHSTLLIAVLCTSALALLPAVPASALPPPGPGVPIWGADWMKNGSGNTNFDPGRTLALRQARTFDLLVAHVSTYDNHIAAMKVVNPNLRVLVYSQGVFSPQGNLPSSWYAHSSGGSKIRWPSFGTYLMNPKSSGWRDYVLKMCRDKLASSHYDGCFLDSMGPTALNKDTMTALPVDPSTGKVYTRRAWLTATEVVAERVRSGLSPRPVFANGLVDGPGYFNSSGPTETLLDGVHGGMSEAFMRSASWGTTYYKGVDAWKNDVDMLVDAGARTSGGTVLAITKVWSSASASQIASWHRYALGSFLLGYRPSHAYFQFRSDHDLTTPSSWWDVNLGIPTSAYSQVNGMYVRSFQNGKVIVNPTSSSHSISLGRRYMDLSGAYRSGSISLPSHTAQVLTNA